MHLHLVGLGCGGGQKDSRLLKSLMKTGRQLDYTAMDVSVAMVLVAHQAASRVIGAAHCHQFVCDMARADIRSTDFDLQSSDAPAKIYTFFGMIPNFEPAFILGKLAAIIRPGDHLLFSANLAPGEDYAAGMERILPLYENELTRQWLISFLLDLGVDQQDGLVRFSIEDSLDGTELKRVVARFHFLQPVQITLNQEQFSFEAGETIQLFFSYRHRPQTMADLLSKHGFEVEKRWVTGSGEEGVFYCRRGSR